MKELIDRQELIEHLQNDPLFDLVERYGVTGVIKAMPTVDAVPVRSGKWIPCMMDNRGYTAMFKCTECKRYSYYAYPVKDLDYRFCPHCGAKMDEVDG